LIDPQWVRVEGHEHDIISFQLPQLHVRVLMPERRSHSVKLVGAHNMAGAARRTSKIRRSLLCFAPKTLSAEISSDKLNEALQGPVGGLLGIQGWLK
jgi:hypothetical protein